MDNQLEKLLNQKYTLEISGLDAVLLNHIIKEFNYRRNAPTSTFKIKIADDKCINMMESNAQHQAHDLRFKSGLKGIITEASAIMLDIPIDTNLNVVKNDGIPTIISDIDFNNFKVSAGKALEKYNKLKK